MATLTAPAPPAETLPPEESEAPTVPARAALMSIGIFWLLYFTVATVRSLVLGFAMQLEMLGPRALVAFTGMALSYLLYRIFNAYPNASLRRSVAMACLLAIPASITFSTVNWLAFRSIEARMPQHKTPKTVIIRAGQGMPSVHVVPGTNEDQEFDADPNPNPDIDPDIDPDFDAHDGEATAPTPPVPPRPSVPSAPGRSDNTTVIQVGGDPSRDDAMTPAHAIGDNAINGYFFFVAWAALFLALRYAAVTQLAERRAARFAAAAQAAELRALRYQVNPHFLFNTLNSLSSLVMVDRREEAEKMILNLSTFFRTSLTADPAEDQPLDEEIRLQMLYLEIEKVRFPERLHVEFAVPAALRNACVPALILQPLVENAIKYGVSRSRRPVLIRVEAREDSEGLVLSVADDGAAADSPDPGGPEPGSGTGLGLRNVRDRLAARFGAAGQCRWGPREGGGFIVVLHMPIVRRGC
jgi:two-component system LytT family sensor kinase